MPAALVKSLAETADIDMAEAERRWAKAKAITTTETGKTEADGEDFWRYVTGVFKRSLGISAITETATAEDVHAAAHEAATSHLNDLPHPTEAQARAGNYKKGRIWLHGLEIVIENPKGSTRSGVDPDGTPWECTLPAHYGDIKRTEGADGDAVDIYIGDHPESELVFVVDQCDEKTGRFDEHKVVTGCLSQKEARTLYIAGFSDGKGAKRLGAMTAMHMPEFKAWLRDGDTTKPLSDAVLESAKGEFFTVSEARAAAKASPDYWKALILDAKTVDDFERAFFAKWPHIWGGDSLVRGGLPEGMNPETFRFIWKEINRVEQEFPELREWVKKVVTKPDGMAEYDVWEKEIRLQRYVAGFTPEEIDKQFPPGAQMVGGGLRGTISHELGHALHHAMIAVMKTDEDKETLFNSIKDLSQELGNPSAYAGKSPSEWLAERFAEEDVNGATPTLKHAIKKVLQGGGAINRLTNNSDGGNVGASTDKEGAMEKGFWASQGSEISGERGGDTVKLLNERGFRVFGFNHQINKKGGGLARTESRYRVLTGNGVEVFSGNSLDKLKVFADQVDLNGTYAADLEYMGSGRPSNTENRTDNDGFFGAYKGTAFYLEKLQELGCPEDLMKVAKDITSGKKVNEVHQNEDKSEQQIVRWDGAGLYYFHKGEWGFERLTIDPSNGYVDFGHGHTPVTPPEDPDKKLKEWERSHDRKGAPTMSTSRAIDAMLRSGYKRGEFRVKTELKKNGDYGDTTISSFDSKTVVERTEALLRNGLKVSWYVEAGKERIMALISPQDEWHSVEAHQDWTGKPGTLEVVNLEKTRDVATFGPDQMEEARALVQAIQKPTTPQPWSPIELKEFYDWYDSFDLGYLEPVRKMVDQTALDNAFDVRGDRVTAARATVREYVDDESTGRELFGSQIALAELNAKKAPPKNPKTGPQRVAVLRSMSADIPGMQDYLARMDAVTTKKELRALDNQKYELIPSLRGSEVKIGGLDLYWIMGDLKDLKEREINKRLKDEAAALKDKTQREKTEAKEREDLQLKRYKERPELKKVLDLISADFRAQIIEHIVNSYTRKVSQYFTEASPRTLTLTRPDPRKVDAWAWNAYQNTMSDLAPVMVRAGADSPFVLKQTWKEVVNKIATDSADIWIGQFKNKMAWKLGGVLERKGGGDVSFAGDVVQHMIRMAFPDGSGFDMRTQQVFARSSKGKEFARYPTTFHNVIFADGSRMSTPSAEKMQKEFGIDTTSADEV